MKSRALGPFTQNSPICETSNTPTPLQTVICSSIIPEYSIGILYPAKLCIFAPRATCVSVKGVLFISNILRSVILSVCSLFYNLYNDIHCLLHRLYWNKFKLAMEDRKSTRLNSSHQIISYAV